MPMSPDLVNPQYNSLLSILLVCCCSNGAIRLSEQGTDSIVPPSQDETV